MASQKREQIIQEADKLVQKGKLDQAIKEYRRALEMQPNDTNALNRLGDLLVRVNRIPDAIEVYQRIAEHFAQDGFFLKAIAIYKKVNRLDPQRTETYERLADLYFKQGLVVEGRQQLTTLADWFIRQHQPTEAVRVFRRLTDLEPDNFQARAKLVDLLVQAGDAGAVVSEIDTLGRALLSRGMLEEAVKLYHRALELKPQDVDFVAPCLDALVTGGRAAQALELGKKALDTGRPGIELRRAAARAAAEAGDLKMARKYLEEVMPEVGDRTDVIQLYGDVMLRVGEAEAAKEQLLPTVDRLLRAGDVARAAALIKRLLRTTPTDIEVLERARKVFDKLGDPDMVASIEVALAESYMRVRKVDEATKLYQRLVRFGPSEPDFRGRLEGLRKALRLPEGGAPPVEAAPPATPEPTRGGAAFRPETRSQPPAVAEGPPGSDVEFVDVDFDDDMGEAPAPAPRVSMAPPDGGTTPRPVVLHPSGETPPPMKLAELASAGVAAPASASEELYTEAVVFAKYGLADKAISHIKRLLAVSPHHEKGLELLRSLGGTFEEPKTSPPPPVERPTAVGPPAAPQPLPEVEVGAAEPELPLLADEEDLLFRADVGGPPVEEAPLGEVDMGFWSAGGASVPEAAPESQGTAELVTPEPGGFEGFDFSDVVVEIPAVGAEAAANAQAPPTESPVVSIFPEAPVVEVVEPAPAPDFALEAAVPPVLEALSAKRGSPLSLADLGEVATVPAPVRSSRPSRGIAELEAMLGLGGGGEPGPPRPRTGQSTPANQTGRKVEVDLGMLGLSERPVASVGPFQSSAPDFSVLDELARPVTVRSGGAALPSAQAGQEQLLDVAPGVSGEPAPVVRPLESVPAGVVVSLPAAPAREPLGQAAGVDDVVPSLEATVPPAAELADVELAEVELAEPAEEAMDLVEVGELLEGPSPDQLGELDFFIREGLLDEAAVMLAKLREAFGDHSELRTRQALLKARGWDEEKPVVSAEAAASELFSEEEGFFDLAKELEKELAEDELVAEATGAGKGQEASIEELFKEFQRGVAEQIGDADFDTHFNLGLAYREMGLLDEAIGEFQLSMRSTELFIESASNVGACYLEKGLPEQAAEWYARGLTSDRLSPEEAIGLRYHLGLAQELAGRADEALGSFTEVLTVNPGFRDAVARVSRLRSN